MATAPTPDKAQQGATPKPTSMVPEQKKWYDLIVKQAMGFLLADENAQAVVKKAQTIDPQTAVLEAVTPVLNNIYATATRAGAKVETVTVLAAGIEIIGVLAKMLEQAGVISEKQIPDFCAAVATRAVAQHNGRVKGMQAKQQGGGQPAQPQQPQSGAQPPVGMMGAAPQPQGAPA